MHYFQYNYRIFKQNDIYYVLIDKKSATLDISKLYKHLENCVKENQQGNSGTYKIEMYMGGELIAGADEIENMSLFFGIAKNKSIDLDKVAYRLYGDKDTDKQMLRISHNGGVLSLYNYSIEEESCGIKLTYQSESAKRISQADKYIKEQKKKNNQSNSNDVLLPPVLSGDKISCMHGGQVVFMPVDGQSFCNDNDSLILEGDLRNAKIVACPNNILGVPKPCTSITLIPNTALSKKTFNDKKAVIQAHLSTILTDNMVGLKLNQAVDPNLWEVLSSSPKTNSGEYEPNLAELISGILSLRYKNIGSKKVCIANTTFENLSSATYANTFNIEDLSINKPLDIIFNEPEKNDEGIDSNIIKKLQEYSNDENIVFKALTIIVDNRIYEYILLIPKAKKSILKKLPKEYRDYGYGKIIELPYHASRTVSENSNNKYNVGNSNVLSSTFLFPAGAKKFLLHIEVLSSAENNTQDKKEISNENMVNQYMSSTDFSNQYSQSFSYYNLRYNSSNKKHSYKFVNTLQCNQKTKVEQGIYIDIENKCLFENTVTKSSAPDNDSFNLEQEKQGMADALYKVLSSENITNFVDTCVCDYEEFLEIVSDKEGSDANSSPFGNAGCSGYYCGLNLDKLKNILDYAVSSKNNIYNDREQYNNELKDVSEHLLRNLIARKVIEVVKDNIIPFASAKDKQEFIFEALGKLKFLVTKVPVVGFIVIAYEIGKAVYEVSKSYTEGPKLMEEFCNVISFYHNLDAELSTILSSKSDNKSVFYKKNINGSYILSLYNSSQDCVSDLGILDYKLQTPCNYVEMSIDENIYNQVTFFAKQNLEEVIINNINNIAQLSIFNSNKDLKVSSNFHHVKDLIMKASAFTMIESSKYSSIFISELIKQGFYSPLGEKINKNLIIITDGIEKHNLVYKSQNYVFTKILTDEKTPNIYTFRLMQDYKISELRAKIIQKLLDIRSSFYESFKGLDTEDVENIVNNENEYKKMQEYADAFAETYKDIFHIKTHRGYFERLSDNFWLYDERFLSYFYVHCDPYTNELYMKQDNMLEYLFAVCSKFGEDINYLYEKKSNYMETVNKYLDYNFKKYPVLNNVSKTIRELHSFVDSMYMITANFTKELDDKDVKSNVDKTISNLKDEVSSFFKTGIMNYIFKDTNIGSQLIAFIRRDKDLEEICKQVVSAEYSYEYSIQKHKLQQLVNDYALSASPHTNDVIYKIDNKYQNIGLACYVKKLYSLFYKISECMNEYTVEEIVDNQKIIYTITHDLYTIDEDIFRKVFYAGIRNHLANILPVKKGSIEFAADDIGYYDLLLESILAKFLLYLKEESVSNNGLGKDDAYLCSYMFTQAFNYINFSRGLDAVTQLQCAKIFQIAYILISDDFVENVSNQHTEKAEKPKQSAVSKAFNKTVKDKLRIYGVADLAENALKTGNVLFGNLPKNLPNGSEDTNLAKLNGLVGDLTNIIDLIRDFSYQKVFELTLGQMKDALFDNMNNPPETAKEYAKIFWGSIKGKFDINISDAVESLKKAISLKGIATSLAFSGAQVGIDFVYEMVAEKFLPVAELEEFEAKTSAVKYAYTTQRIDNKGALYNEGRDMIALPVKITQNYLMSDFRAALIGGASFDNDCFVRGTSAGIFIQDNDKVSENFIYKLCDYIYNVPLDTIDDKNAIYIEAYKKIITYLFDFGYNIDKLNKLYNNTGSVARSNYGKVIKAPDVLNKSKNNEHYNINAQDEKYIQVSYIDDFAIQLKRFGEYNYKYFYSHQDLISENSGSSDSLDGNIYDNVKPILLGSLVYDKEWIDNKVEE